MGRYDVTEVYGDKIEDYNARLVDIWEKCQTSAAGGLIPSTSVVNPITRTYPAFTMEVANKVQAKMMKEKMIIPQRSDDSMMINVDQIQTGIDEALSEIDLSEGSKITAQKSTLDGGPKPQPVQSGEEQSSQPQQKESSENETFDINDEESKPQQAQTEEEQLSQPMRPSVPENETFNINEESK